jgi:hypothetical protein
VGNDLADHCGGPRLQDENGRTTGMSSQPKVRGAAFFGNKESRDESYLLLQFRVLRLGLLQDGDVGVDVFSRNRGDKAAIMANPLPASRFRLYSDREGREPSRRERGHPLPCLWVYANPSNQ